MNGQPAAEEMRRRGYKGLIIGLTGHAAGHEIDSFIMSGADHVFLKPLRHEEFLRVTAGTRKVPASLITSTTLMCFIFVNLFRTHSETDWINSSKEGWRSIF
jgi:DNA-binding response OmpR family regulator